MTTAVRAGKSVAAERSVFIASRASSRVHKVAEPNDAYEQEADRVANRVMDGDSVQAVWSLSRIPVEPAIQRKCACGGSGQCDECKDEHKIQRKANGPLPSLSQDGSISASAGVDRALAHPGTSLNRSLEFEMARRFGYDFSRVRVHTGAVAEQSSRELNARAYTVGHNIVFGAGQFAPDTREGKRLLAHELTHVVQQHGGAGERIQRAPDGASGTSVKALDSLEEVANRIARLAIGESSAAMKAVNLKGGPGPVISVVRNVKTGKIYVGLNTGTPTKMTKSIEAAIKAQRGRIAAGEVKVVHTAADAVGGHAEVNALNSAEKEAQAELGLDRAMTEAERGATFEMHTIWLSGKKQLTTAPRCEHCSYITRGVKVTESVFKAEGGVSGEINVPQHGKAVLTGGRTVEADTIHGEIPVPKPTVKPTATVPEPAMTVPTKKGVRPAKPQQTAPAKPPATTTRAPKAEPAPAPPAAKPKSGSPPATAQKATPVAPSSGSLTKERVTVDYDLASAEPKSTIKLNLADYPPDREGRITRFFKDRPVLKQLSSVGVTLTAQYAKNKAFELVQSHFESALDKARKDFQRSFPEAVSLSRNARIDDRRKAYYAALAKLSAPDRRRKLVIVLAAIGPEKGIDARLRAAEEYLASLGDTTAVDIKNYRAAAEAYENDMIDVVTELAKYRGTLTPDIVSDIRKRASVLQGASQNLADTFWSIMGSPLAGFPLVYYESWDIYFVSEIFKDLASHVGGFATEIEARRIEYEDLDQLLDEELVKVANQLNRIL